MRKSTLLNALLILFASSIFSISIAESIPVKDSSVIVGSWKLTGTARKLDGEQYSSQQSWQFRKDGTLVSTAAYDSGTGPYATKIDEFSVKVKYEIKDGKILAGVPGRPGKKLTYHLIEREGNKMTLRQGSGEFMFFEKQ